MLRLYSGLAASTAMDKTMEPERDGHSVRTIQWFSRVNSHKTMEPERDGHSVPTIQWISRVNSHR